VRDFCRIIRHENFSRRGFVLMSFNLIDLLKCQKRFCCERFLHSARDCHWGNFFTGDIVIEGFIAWVMLYPV